MVLASKQGCQSCQLKLRVAPVASARSPILDSLLILRSFVFLNLASMLVQQESACAFIICERDRYVALHRSVTYA